MQVTAMHKNAMEEGGIREIFRSTKISPNQTILITLPVKRVRLWARFILFSFKKAQKINFQREFVTIVNLDHGIALHIIFKTLQLKV